MMMDDCCETMSNLFSLIYEEASNNVGTWSIKTLKFVKEVYDITDKERSLWLIRKIVESLINPKSPPLFCFKMSQMLSQLYHTNFPFFKESVIASGNYLSIFMSNRSENDLIKASRELLIQCCQFQINKESYYVNNARKRYISPKSNRVYMTNPKMVSRRHKKTIKSLSPVFNNFVQFDNNVEAFRNIL